MARNPEAYVDTSALIAFADRSDSYHLVFRRLFSNPPPLLTSSLVIAEGHGWFLRRYNAGKALLFLAMIEEMGFLSVASVGSDEIATAVNALKRFPYQELTLVDAFGLQLMNERKIGVCWSTDFHLGLGGASLVVNT